MNTFDLAKNIVKGIEQGLLYFREVSIIEPDSKKPTDMYEVLLNDKYSILFKDNFPSLESEVIVNIDGKLEYDIFRYTSSEILIEAYSNFLTEQKEIKTAKVIDGLCSSIGQVFGLDEKIASCFEKNVSYRPANEDTLKKVADEISKINGVVSPVKVECVNWDFPTEFNVITGCGNYKINVVGVE